MEILFKSPTQPLQTLTLSEAITESLPDTISSLITALRDTTLSFTSSISPLFTCQLHCLRIQETFFRPAIQQFHPSATPPLTSKEKKVIEACISAQYEEDDIEGAFYRHGGFAGIIALILVFRKTDAVQGEWTSITVEEGRKWLVGNVVLLAGEVFAGWILDFGVTRDVYQEYTIQYLGRHAGRKRKKITPTILTGSGSLDGSNNTRFTFLPPNSLQRPPTNVPLQDWLQKPVTESSSHQPKASSSISPVAPSPPVVEGEVATGSSSQKEGEAALVGERRVGLAVHDLMN